MLMPMMREGGSANTFLPSTSCASFETKWHPEAERERVGENVKAMREKRKEKEKCFSEKNSEWNLLLLCFSLNDEEHMSDEDRHSCSTMIIEEKKQAQVIISCGWWKACCLVSLIAALFLFFCPVGCIIATCSSVDDDKNQLPVRPRERSFESVKVSLGLVHPLLKLFAYGFNVI